MRKSSRSISLALIGSALVLSGCQPSVVEEPESEWGDTGATATADGIATGNDQYNSGQHHSGGGGRTASRIGGALIGSQIGRTLGGGGGGMSSAPGNGGGFGGSMAPSARGGFGSSAGASASS